MEKFPARASFRDGAASALPPGHVFPSNPKESKTLLHKVDSRCRPYGHDRVLPLFNCSVSLL